MSGFQLLDAEGAPVAVLLVMLPSVAYGAPPTPPAAAPDTFSVAALAALRGRLSPAVRVLKIDEASYPAIVRSFAPAQLPTWVLMRRGVELGRQPGLPTADEVGALLAPAAGPPGS